MAEDLRQRVSDQGELAVEARYGKREGTIAKNVPLIAYRFVARSRGQRMSHLERFVKVGRTKHLASFLLSAFRLSPTH